MSELLPCSKCNHECAVDAAVCPNCGTKDVHEYPKYLVLGGLGNLAIAFIGKDNFPSLSTFWFFISVLTILAGIFRSSVLKFIANHRK